MKSENTEKMKKAFRNLCGVFLFNHCFYQPNISFRKSKDSSKCICAFMIQVSVPNTDIDIPIMDLMTIRDTIENLDIYAFRSNIYVDDYSPSRVKVILDGSFKMEA